MEYECQLASLSKMLYGKDGIVLPLCNFCKSKDCTNTIQTTDLSILGVTIKCRVYVRFDNFYAVTKCDGFLPDEDDKEKEEKNDEENNSD